MVSIHAPRVGRDASIAPDEAKSYVSIHAPRVGRDSKRGIRLSRCSWFQFTRPAWGATFGLPVQSTCAQFQFTRPAWGATQFGPRIDRYVTSFNSRAPRGARRGYRCTPTRSISFNSRAPRGARRVSPPKQVLRMWRFNSRAPRGARLTTPSRLPATMSFNSRAPRGARQNPQVELLDRAGFQFTRPAWGATVGTVTPSLAVRKVNDSAYPAEIKGCSVVKERSIRVSGCTTASCEDREPP